MARLYGVCLGLLLFSAIIICGMLAGNSAERIVLRAVLGLVGGFVVGATAGWIGLSIVKDNVPVYDGEAARTPERGEEDKTAQVVSARE